MWFAPSDTRVSLAIWDPSRSLDSIQDHVTQSDAGPQAKVDEKKREKLSIPHTSGPGAGFLCQQLEEKDFPDCENFKYIGESDFRFFLRIAGSELFYPKISHKFQDMGFTTRLRSTSSKLSVTSEMELGSSLDCTTLSPACEPARLASTSKGIDNPITSPKPLQIVVNLSKKTFLKVPFGDYKQDLCINIFFNGEFAQSRIIKARRLFGDKSATDDLTERYSGRRADTALEKPWIVLPLDQTKEGCLRVPGVSEISLVERWKQVGELLLAESDKWTSSESSTNPLGDYLKTLGELALPASANTAEAEISHRIGIIDVVLVLGTTIAAAVSGLRSPQRKLHESICGLNKKLVTVPEPLRWSHSSLGLTFPTPTLTTERRRETVGSKQFSNGLARSQTQTCNLAMLPPEREARNTNLLFPTVPVAPIGQVEAYVSSDIVLTMSDLGINDNMGCEKPLISPVKVAVPVLSQYHKAPETAPWKTHEGTDGNQMAHTTRSKIGTLIPSTTLRTGTSQSMAMSKNNVSIKESHRAGGEDGNSTENQLVKSQALSKELNSLMLPYNERNIVNDSLELMSEERPRPSQKSSGTTLKPTPKVRAASKNRKLSKQQSTTKSRSRDYIGGSEAAQTKSSISEEQREAILISQASQHESGATGPQQHKKRTFSTISESGSDGNTVTKRRAQSPESKATVIDGPPVFKERWRKATAKREESTKLTANVAATTTKIAKGTNAPTINTKSMSKNLKEARSHQTQASPNAKEARSKYMSLESRRWKPHNLNDDSVITYAETPLWPDIPIDPASGVVLRATHQEREGVFRGNDILFGTRFVVGL